MVASSAQVAAPTGNSNAWPTFLFASVCFLGTYCFLHVTPTVQTPGGLAFSCRKQVPGRSQLSSASRVRELSELQRNICQSCLRLFLRDPSAPCAKVPEPAYIARQIGSRLQLEQVLDGALAQLCQARTPSRSRLSPTAGCKSVLEAACWASYRGTADKHAERRRSARWVIPDLA